MEQKHDATELLRPEEQLLLNNINNLSSRALAERTLLNSQYRVDAILGEGGFGITYRCFDLFLKINVAIKEYFPVQFATRNMFQGNKVINVISGEREQLYIKGLKDYEYEANRLTKFSDLDGIVSVLNFFYENNTAYMVMEYVEGITLKNYLNEHEGKIPWKDTLEMIYPVINSLKQVHEEGIIHRDISPDNIMISNEKRITIIDFGAARNEEDEKSKTIMLKKGYAPPEQYFKKGYQGSWTDVYALCATIYEMITGERLPESLSIKTGDSHYKPMHDYVLDIPKNVEKIIFRGLAIEIEDRIPTMEILEEYLYKGTFLKLCMGQKRKYRKILIGAFSLITVALIVGLLGKSLLQKASDSILLDTTDEGVSAEKQTQAGQSQVEEVNLSEYAPVSIEEAVTIDILPEHYLNIPEVPITNIVYENVGESIKITGLNYAMTDVKIPAIIEGLPVTRIEGVGVNVTSLVVPEGTESLGQYTFNNCVYLESVYLPSTLNQITAGAFDNCLSLQTVDISSKNENFYVEGNTLYNKDGTIVVSWTSR